jgi:hypothetical protein
MIPLPPLPRSEDFPDESDESGYSHVMYMSALAAWERVCKEIVAANLAISRGGD